MEAPPLERRLAAILAADVEGYSRLMLGDEEATMAMLSARRAVVDEFIVRHRGRIANTAGDSVLAPSPRSPERGLLRLHCLRPALRQRPPRSLRTRSILLSGSQSRIARDAKSSRLI